MTPQCWQVSEDAIAKYSTVQLSHWDEHVELLAGVTKHHCFQLVHDVCCSAGRCGIWSEWVFFQVRHTSTLRYSETSLCSIACMRPWLVCAECCDIHAVLCRQRHLSSSVNSLPTHIAVVELCRCAMFPSCPSSFSYFRWLRMLPALHLLCRVHSTTFVHGLSLSQLGNGLTYPPFGEFTTILTRSRRTQLLRHEEGYLREDDGASE